VIPIEDFFVDDIHARVLEDTFHAYRKKYRMFQLDEMVRQGFLDETNVTKVRAFYSDSERTTDAEKDKQFTPDMSLQDDMSMRTLYFGYMRYRPEGETQANLYQCVYHRAARTPLSLRKAAWEPAVDASPIRLVRIGKKPGELFGTGIVRRLAALQEMADSAINAHLALNKLAANPPFTYRADSAFGRYLDKNGPTGIRAGMGIPSLSVGQQRDVDILQFPNPGLNIQDVRVSNDMASQATYSEESIGSPTAGRKTLGQFQVEVHKGTIRLRLDLTDFAYDMSELLTMYYSMVCAYKIRPAGIIAIESNGKLIAADEIPASDVSQAVLMELVPMLQSGQIRPEEYELVDREIGDMLTNGRIPAAIRDDLSITLTGTRIIADKVAEIEMMHQFTPFIMSPGMTELLQQDSYINYHVRQLGHAMGFTDMAKRIPADPGKFMDPAQRNLALMPFMETFRQQSTV
jgi:hypothetical protein